MEKIYRKKVETLIITGRNAPCEEESSGFRLSDGPEAFRNEMKRYGLIPEELLEDEEFMCFYTPMIYHDYRLSECYRSCDEHILKTPVHFDFAMQDEDLREEKIKGWKNYTSGEFSCTEHEGNHFFMFENQYDYFRNLIQNRILQG